MCPGAIGRSGSETARYLCARSGGGLIFTAGESTFGEKGFANSSIEKLLPVKFEGEGKRKDLDLVLLLDRSFSMRGQKWSTPSPRP